MQAIRFGSRTLSLALEPDQRVTVHRGPAPLPDVPAAVLAALDAPFLFPPLRQALTPDDRLALVLDPNVADPAALVDAVTGYLRGAGLTLEGFAVVRADEPVVEAPAYLATTRAGRRVYLHRAVVEADQVITVSVRRHAALGFAGAEASFFPALSDEETRRSPHVAGEAQEVAWLLGLPFHVQLIDAAGGGVSHIIAGAGDAAREAERLLALHWSAVLPRRPDTVIASVPRFGWDALARAAAVAAAVIQPGGRIVLLADGDAPPPPGFDAIRAATDAESATRKAEGAAGEWARAASHARLSLLSGVPRGMVEELFAAALDDEAQAQRLAARSGDLALVEDADRFSLSVG